MQKKEHDHPKLCKTIDYLLSYTCKEVAPTAKSLNKVYDEHLPELSKRFEKVLNDFTRGAYLGILFMIVEKKKRRYDKAEVFKWELDAKQPFTNYSGSTGLQAIEVVLMFWEDGALVKGSHSAVLLVDPTNRIVEYSDPHGAAAWNPVVYEALKHSVDNAFPGSSFLPPWETCPHLGVQSLLNEGLCGLFSTLYAFLRMRCPSVSPLELQTYLVSLGHRRLREITAGWLCLLLS